ncbi:MAG: tetratricopeptide repeat protein [Myxococcota bacterium]|nr:tetratricopeptide repeat protein [Myxococcota bacterium]MDW8362674.1 tetratricopeptide repeat protein [Myxococcales bacterium]
MNASARSAFEEGVRAAARGDFGAAASAFQQALAEDPNAFRAAYNLGVLADRAGNEGRALEYYRRALRIQPDYEAAAAGIVAIHIRRGAVSDAIAFIEPLAREWERNLHLQALYAETLVQADRVDEAMAAARAALRRDERFVPAMVAIIKASLKRGRTELASSVLEQALRIDPNHAELHFLNGQLLRAQPGRLREAIESFRRAVELRPDFIEARTELGLQLLAGGNYADALAHFEHAARLAPTLPQIHLHLGDGYRVNRRWQQAKASIDRALSIEPDLPEAYYNLGLLYMTAGAEFPGPDLLTALQLAVESIQRYRNMMGPRLRRDDPSQSLLEDLQRRIEGERRRIEREEARRRREAERAAREAARQQQGGGNAGGGSGESGGGAQGSGGGG